MKSLKKTTLASLVGAAALATAGAANATIVVGGDNGYEFSVDGNINQFFVATDGESTDSNRVRNGLLPTFFGFNVAAPEINGLKVGARVSISPSTNGGSYFDESQNGNAMEQREAFATVDGSFGQILAGKALGLYSSNNILLDQTLFGVGAVVPENQDDGQTTLGRIGYGYDYANWRSQIRYTTPDMNGFKAALAVMDAEQKGAGTTTERDEPRWEAELSYATAFDGGSVKAWADYMTQKVETTLGDVDSDAWTVGAQLVFAGFEVVGTYYDNEGVGDLGGLLHSTATDATGDEREGDGYYVQAGYRFAGTTFLAASYGESTLDRTSAEKAANLTGGIDSRELATVGIYHDVTANLKLVAEYSKQEEEFHGVSGSDDHDIFAIGGFVTW
ncbi:porin [Methylophaga sp. OBS4]|uniref:porin n=1 Tax=Methylophaga sp. OBS4 TaxID=2991935 RepID=UPI002251ADA8|nr:porin [Methylophaga sp. OBS4]MCX4187339.1 porin [Methylophaga sp. OBS4]